MFIDTTTYLNLKRLISDYENNNGEIEQPYLLDIHILHKYNPKYGDSRVCKCGHQYHRHFDSYEHMDAIGCKYCDCYEFEETPVYSDGFIGEGYIEFAPIEQNLWFYDDLVKISNGKIQIRGVWYDLTKDFIVKIKKKNSNHEDSF